MDDLNVLAVLAGVLAGASPIVLATMGETITEKAGLINLSLDGTILLAAMVAFLVAHDAGSLGLGFLAAALVGAGIAAVVGIAGVYMGQSQVAVGFVLTLMCRDLAYFLGNPYSRIQGPRLAPLPVPGLERLPLLGSLLFRHSLLVYLSVAVIATTWWYLYRTRWGLELRAVGENPQAAHARGIDPKRLQLLHALLGGALVGLAGGAFSLGIKPGWGRPQGAEGMGWIALAIVIFGGWHPLKVALGAYLFAFLQVLSIPLQSWWPSVPAQVFQVAPFPLMILALLLLGLTQKDTLQRWADAHPRVRKLLRSIQGRAPRALGRPYRQE